LIDKAMEIIQKEIAEQAVKQQKPVVMETPRVEVIEEEPRRKGFFGKLFG
jgi:hypothetical protein